MLTPGYTLETWNALVMWHTHISSICRKRCAIDAQRDSNVIQSRHKRNEFERGPSPVKEPSLQGEAGALGNKYSIFPSAKASDEA